MGPGVDQTSEEVLRLFTTAIDIHDAVVGFTGGLFAHPDGGVPVLVIKLQEPPVGVAG
jgi:hypothetical protein